MTNNPFWDFSLAHYAKQPVQQLCLQLQEQAGANVNVVLFTLWLAAENRAFDNTIVAEHSELQSWHEQVILPLRQARCAVKRSRQSASLYGTVKTLDDQQKRTVETHISLCAGRRF